MYKNVYMYIYKGIYIYEEFYYKELASVIIELSSSKIIVTKLETQESWVWTPVWVQKSENQES